MSFDLKTYLLLKQMGETSGTINGGVTSWNDLTDKPFYEEIAEITVLDNQTLTFAGDDPAVYMGAVSSSVSAIEAWDSVDVVFDDVLYANLPCKVENGVVMFGNPFDSGNPIPFAVGMQIFEGEVSAQIFAFLPGESHTISATAIAKVIHHIDSNYIKDMYGSDLTEVVSGSINNIVWGEKPAWGYASAASAEYSDSIYEWMNNLYNNATPEGYRETYDVISLTVNGKTRWMTSAYPDYANFRAHVNWNNGNDRVAFFQADFWGTAITFTEGVLTCKQISERGVKLFGLNSPNEVTDIEFTIYTGTLNRIDEKYIPDSIARSNDIWNAMSDIEQTDWSENNEDSSAYVKNRTHYTEIDNVLEDTNVVFEVDDGWVTPSTVPQINVELVSNVEKQFYVRLNGEEYECVCSECEIDGMKRYVIGDAWDTNPIYPFRIWEDSEKNRHIEVDLDRCNVGINYNGTILPKLPKYDKNAYPYAYILKSGILIVANEQFWCDVDSTNFYSVETAVMAWNLVNNEWTNERTFTYEPNILLGQVDGIIWTNVDMMDEDKVYFATYTPSCTVNLSLDSLFIKTLSEKYIPDTIARVSDVSAEAVLYTEQNLSDEQQAQARENIGALSEEDVELSLEPIDRVMGLTEESRAVLYELFFEEMDKVIGGEI